MNNKSQNSFTGDSAVTEESQTVDLKKTRPMVTAGPLMHLNHNSVIFFYGLHSGF